MTPDSTRRAGATAVVVNDDVTQLNVLTELLRKEGINVRAFESAESALSVMGVGGPPDLIITDLYMPGIDGWRFCRLLRSPEYAAFNEVPVLVVSATFVGEQVSRITSDLGANAFLASPMDGRLFVDSVKALLGGQRLREPLRVLIVEDSKTLAGLLSKTFEKHEYRADIALTAASAVDAFRRDPFHVAVIDYHLPDGKGDALLVEFQRVQPDCVCIMMTTDPSPELAVTWMRQGAAAYLRKPFDPQYLLELSARARRERALLRVEDLLEARTRELRENQGRLGESNQILAGVLEHTHMMAVFLDSRFNFIWVNRAYADTCRREPSFFRGRNHFDLYPHEENQAIFQRVVDTGEPFFVEAKPFEFPDQPERGVTYWDWSLIPVKDGAGRVSGLVFTLADVTRRIRAENRIREREANFRNLFESMTDMVVVSRPDGRILFTNPAATETLGYGVEELAFMHVLDLYPVDLRPEAETIFNAMLRGERESCPLPLARKGGGLVMVDTRACFGEWDGAKCVFRIFKDLTAEEEARQRFERLFRNNPLPMALTPTPLAGVSVM